MVYRSALLLTVVCCAVMRDVAAQNTQSVNDPLWNSQGYLHSTGPNPNKLRLPQVWQFTVGDTGIIVGIVDSPIRWTHRDLRKVPHLASSSGGAFHGTAVASIIGAQTDNNFGMAGIMRGVTLAHATLLTNLHTLDEPEEEIDEAYGELATYSPHITTHSYHWPKGHHGGQDDATPEYYPELHRFFVNSRNAGIVHFAAAGNNPSSISPPGSLDESVISVVALDALGNQVEGTNQGVWRDFGAQGFSIVAAHAADDDSFTVSFANSSASTPQIAGMAGLLLAHGRTVGQSFDCDDIRGKFQVGDGWPVVAES